MSKLQPTAVVHAALELLNEVGVDGLTTRKLAQRLGVQQPALYWHFKNKRALLDALADAMLAQEHSYSQPKAGDDWRSFLIGNARSFRRALLAYRDGARIHAGTRPGESQMETAEAQLRLLCESGFSVAEAVNALMTISHFTVGAVLEQQAADGDTQAHGGTVEQAPLPPLLRAAIDAIDSAGPDAVFEQGLMLIVDGLAKRRRVLDSVGASTNVDE
ncbi:Tetracycline resistance regulatory protein TetR [Pseudomonas synxantha]|uniref:tetracycline resistance transcriptional repressor TetR n=1 Tax=Pseudomonas synxantha TaxID=47883 RepID=UPI000F58E0A4|nr:tetracycline resistance transcriptional repressor TetR [Pseudomonas synxantha]AZE73893.1 Tetracycline resistance regulatory protein TetR [Pseudomonas synxantha]AZE79496.1 Tetracycline resistance regulatory protein TetR [Pseudomonas synxantha]